MTNISKIYKSRRGDYVVWDCYKENKLSIFEINEYIKGFEGIERIEKLCTDELNYILSENPAIYDHPFWIKEDKKLLDAYISLYNNFMNNFNNSKYGSKNIFSCNQNTCISTLQIHGSTLYVFQRSCDLSLGYLADMITLKLLMEKTNCNFLDWKISIPHVYVNNLKQTFNQFKNRVKIKMNFNIRPREEVINENPNK